MSDRETPSVLIAGGGIGGLAAALAALRAGWDVRLFEKAAGFGEIGAGIQLSPNVMNILHAWDLAVPLAEVAAFPEQLQIRSAMTGRLLGELSLKGMAARYGAPYATVHRADLHAVLLRAVRKTDACLYEDCALQAFTQRSETVGVQMANGLEMEGDVLVGADGLWSTVRQQLLDDGPPRRVGHLAYRALVPQAVLPASLRSYNITVWLGPRMHLVQYPVRSNEWLNVVLLLEEGADQLEPAAPSWDQAVRPTDLVAATKSACTPLQALVAALPQWRVWPLCDRMPMQGAWQHALGRVALLGDAAHPMLPYLAQGAGMAIEDAAELGDVLARAYDWPFKVPMMLQLYALNRWQRNAKVQALALRNAKMFHANGMLRVARDAALKLLGKRLLDMPWLYGVQPKTYRLEQQEAMQSWFYVEK